MIRTLTLPVGPLQTNCYIVWKDDTKNCIVIDPGAEGDKILLECARLRLTIKYVFLTHGHVDHIGAARFIAESTGAETFAHSGDAMLFKTATVQAPLFGMKPFKAPKITKYVEDGEEINLDGILFRVAHTPGHSPGSISLITDGATFVGDLIFMDSIGRTDLPGGSFDTLIRSVEEKIFTLPDETVIYPGHGMDTTVGREKRMNPFF